MLPPVDSAAVERFRQDLSALAPDVAGLGVAVSGGPDSMALLLLAQAALPGRILAATVDHGLRPESADEASFVGSVCAELGVRHDILRGTVDTAAASLQQSARQARYAALDQWLVARDLHLLATAHHADDQAETLLMRLVRGAGVSGLAGVRASGPVPASGSGARLLRPLLGWRRSELCAIVEAAGIEAVADPSNGDPRFDRARMRARLREADWIDPPALARSAAALADADEALAWAAAAEIEARLRRSGERTLFAHRGLPRELKRRILHAILDRLGSSTRRRGIEIDRLLHQLEQGGTATLAEVKCIGGAEWSFERAPARRSGA